MVPGIGKRRESVNRLQVLLQNALQAVGVSEHRPSQRVADLGKVVGNRRKIGGGGVGQASQARVQSVGNRSDLRTQLARGRGKIPIHCVDLGSQGRSGRGQIIGSGDGALLRVGSVGLGFHRPRDRRHAQAHVRTQLLKSAGAVVKPHPQFSPGLDGAVR